MLNSRLKPQLTLQLIGLTYSVDLPIIWGPRRIVRNKPPSPSLIPTRFPLDSMRVEEILKSEKTHLGLTCSYTQTV